MTEIQNCSEFAHNPEQERLPVESANDPEDFEHEPTAAEQMAWRRDAIFAPEADCTPSQYPSLWNMSAAFMFDGVVRPVEPSVPEYLTVPMHPGLGSEEDTKTLVAVSRWNMLWEAGQFRRRFFDFDALPVPMAAVADLGDINVNFVPRTQSGFFEYAPMLHLLPKRTLEMFGLPLLRRGQWPFIADYAGVDDFIPDDFKERLSRAWAWTVWRNLQSGSKMHAFSPNDPIKLLAHNLDFWLPAVTATIEGRLREFPEADKGKSPDELGVPVTLEDGSILPGAVTGQPRKGGTVWMGEADASYAIEETIENADQTGRLRDIMDAVQSNRVEDDFSDKWSYAREDFERKLRGKRRKIKVTFVEVPDTIAVQGPESDIIGNSVTNDFMAMLDSRNRAIVVLLNSGYTSNTEIAATLGYANHSAVSKRLAQIRSAAEQFFDEN